MKAIGKALAIFSSDRIRAVFAKMRSGNFVQISKTESRKKYDEAAKLLAAKAQSSGDERMRTLANEVALIASGDTSVFEPVCKKIYEFKTMLENEKSEWQAFVEDCNSAKSDLDSQLTHLELEMQNLDMDIAVTSSDLDQNTVTRERLNDTIQRLKDSLGQTTAARTEEHENFLSEHGNMAAAVEAMTEALRILKNEYASFLQTQAPDFEDYQSQDGGGVITLIEGIKTDVESNMNQAVTQENTASQTYGDYVMTTNADLKATLNMLSSAEERKAKLELRLEERETMLSETTAERDGKQDALDKKTKDCRFRTDNLATKVGAIDSEVAVLSECTGILKCVPPRKREEWEDA